MLFTQMPIIHIRHTTPMGVVMMKKNIAALLVFVMVFALASPSMAAYRTGSAAGDGVAYGAGGAVVGGGAYVAVAWLFGVVCPPAAIASAAIIGGAYLGWYGVTEPDKTLKKDVENTVAAGVYGTAAGIGAAELIEKGSEKALQAAF
ncbi:MAG: hypothetical protein IJQ24_06105 [Synergistaceae bacterium]|nr:hypothetical protein [Synergistaceae bacterium]